MTKLQLYKFITNNNLEYHCTLDKNDVLLFIDLNMLEEWNKLLGPSIFDEEGLKIVMKYGYCVFEMEYICEYFGIDLKEIFEIKD